MPRKPATDEQRDAVRRRIQKAAAAIFAEQGVAGVSARAIAQQAEVSVGTIYTYFGSLQGLMQSLWVAPVEAVNRTLVELARSVPDPLDRVKALLLAYVDVAVTRPELHRGAFLFVRPAAEAAPARTSPDAAPFPALLAAAIREGQALGTIRPGDPDRLAQVAWSGLHGALALPINFDRIRLAEGPSVAVEMADLMVDALGPARAG